MTRVKWHHRVLDAVMDFIYSRFGGALLVLTIVVMVIAAWGVWPWLVGLVLYAMGTKP